MSDQKKLDPNLRYVHPPGERFFSVGVLSFCGFLGAIQTLLISTFAEQGVGYQYVFACVILVHIYVYRRAWHLTRKDRKEPTNFYSLMVGYLSLGGLLYALPLALAAFWALLGADSVTTDTFVTNNRALLEWAVHLDLPAKRPMLDWAQHKNAINIYYLTLAMLMATLCIVLSAPLVWLKARGWSDYFDVNPLLFARWKKIYCLVVAAALSIYFIYCYVSRFSYGYEILADGSFGSFKGTRWQRQVAAWCAIGWSYSSIASIALGSALNLIKDKRPAKGDDLDA
jgi:hypothetical protein